MTKTEASLLRSQHGQPVFSSFIPSIEWLNLDDYPGRVARCRFSLANYQDGCFDAIGMSIPEHLARAVPKRRAEYLAGRYLARELLATLGLADFTLLRGEDRAPQWPQGIAGAISHNADTALCAVHRENALGGVGLDVETLIPTARAEELWGAIISETECEYLRAQPQAFNWLLTLVFSAKESLFKALYPQVRSYFDFLDARLVAVDIQQQTFAFELLKHLTPHCHAGRRFGGRYWQQGDDVTTFICL